MAPLALLVMCILIGLSLVASLMAMMSLGEES